MNGAVTRRLVPRAIARVRFNIVEESSEMKRSERVIDGGFSKTPNDTMREALRLSAHRRAHDRGIVTILVAANAIPKRRLAEYHGTRLRCIWRLSLAWASGRTSRYHRVAMAFAPILRRPPSGLIKAALTWPRQRAVVWIRRAICESDDGSTALEDDEGG